MNKLKYIDKQISSGRNYAITTISLTEQTKKERKPFGIRSFLSILKVVSYSATSAFSSVATAASLVAGASDFLAALERRVRAAFLTAFSFNIFSL